MKRLTTLITGFILLPVMAVAATIHIPADQPTIQAGINAAVNGDTVLVAPGTYAENVYFQGKRVIVKGRGGTDSTTITAASGTRPAVSFTANEPKGAVLQGFTVTGGTDSSGIFCLHSSPTILENTIRDNKGVGTNMGGGINLRNTQGSLVKANRIFDNHAGTYGAAIHVGDDGVSSTQDTIAYNVIYGNVGIADIRVLGTVAGLEVNNNTISVVTYCGISVEYGGYATVRNNIVFAGTHSGIRSAGGTILAEYNCTFDNAINYSDFTPGVGNIYQNAMFQNASAHDYRLLSGSPCINAGDPTPQYNDPDGSRNDMGAFPSLSEGVPYATAINYGPSASGPIVFTLTPMFYWSFFDTAATSQTGFEIEVGTDANWAVAEMWSSGSVMLSDTSVTYGGLPLSDQQEYYLRIRLHNGIAWGSWKISSFNTHIPKCIHVPSQQPTIQAGINAAVDGDTVLVAPGVYSECISFKGKRIMVLSSFGPTNTEIVASQTDTPVVSFVNGEQVGATISGFTVRGSSNASGILCRASSPTIVNNIITGNTCPWGNYGGGITLYNTTGSVIKGNVIHHNTSPTYAGAIHVGDDHASSTQDTIAYNIIYGNVGIGDIRTLGNVAGLEVNNNTISVVTYCGIYAQGGSTNVRNNIVFGGPEYGMRSNGGAILAEYNCTFGNAINYNFTPGVGNIYQDAMFRDTSAHDYRLLSGSPCINAGDPNPIYNDHDGSRNDIGACPGTNHVPLSFALLTPANATSVGVSTLRPLFSWNPSVDPDTGDIVTYDLIVAADSNFSFVQQVMNLTATSHTLTTDLQWGRQYWWNVKASDGNGGEIWSPQVFTFRTMTLGDADDDAIVTVADIVFLINYIFVGGDAPQPLMTGDPNCDGRTNLADVVYLINYVFTGGPAPCDGFPN